jgi:hypothetical protein
MGRREVDPLRGTPCSGPAEGFPKGGPSDVVHQKG